ncbi:MAG: flagellar hook-length control protein FliK, partial [Sphingorhabdus sp.]
ANTPAQLALATVQAMSNMPALPAALSTVLPGLSSGVEAMTEGELPDNVTPTTTVEPKAASNAPWHVMQRRLADAAGRKTTSAQSASDAELSASIGAEKGEAEGENPSLQIADALNKSDQSKPVAIVQNENMAPVPLAMPVIDAANAKAVVPARSLSARAAKDMAVSSASATIGNAAMPGQLLEDIAQKDTARTGLPNAASNSNSTSEPKAKDTAFDAALGLANIAPLSGDARPVGAETVGRLTDLSGPAMIAERHLDLARDMEWLDQLATDIVSASEHTDHISFRLSPANLGQMDIDLLTGAAGLSVNIATTTDEAGRIVSAAQPSLVESLQAQGIRVADTQVTSGNDMARGNQSQRQSAPHHLIETAFEGTDEPKQHTNERPDGRFA